MSCFGRGFFCWLVGDRLRELREAEEVRTAVRRRQRDVGEKAGWDHGTATEGERFKIDERAIIIIKRKKLLTLVLRGRWAFFLDELQKASEVFLDMLVLEAGFPHGATDLAGQICLEVNRLGIELDRLRKILRHRSCSKEKTQRKKVWYEEKVCH